MICISCSSFIAHVLRISALCIEQTGMRALLSNNSVRVYRQIQPDQMMQQDLVYILKCIYLWQNIHSFDYIT